MAEVGQGTGDIVNPEVVGGGKDSVTAILEEGADDAKGKDQPTGAPPATGRTPEGDEVVVLNPDEPPAPKKEGEGEKETSLEDQVQDALEEEDAIDEIDSAEIEVLLGRPTPTAITKKYPEFFKEFPGVRQALFREAKYSGVFPTVEDAEEAKEKSQFLDSLETTIMEGRPGPMLSVVRKEDPQAYRVFALNFLPTLYEGDQRLYNEVTHPILARLVRWIDSQGRSTGNVNVQNTAIVLSKLLWPDGQGKIPNDPGAPPKAQPRQQPIGYMNIPEGKNFVESISTGAHRALTKELERTFDPERALPERIRAAAIDQIIAEVGEKLESDSQHMANMDALFRRAQRSGFSRDEKPRILTAYLGRARQLLPGIRDQYRKDATRQAGPASGSTARPNLGGGGTQSAGNKRQVNPADIDWTKTTAEMYLNDQVVLKKR